MWVKGTTSNSCFRHVAPFDSSTRHQPASLLVLAFLDSGKTFVSLGQTLRPSTRSQQELAPSKFRSCVVHLCQQSLTFNYHSVLLLPASTAARKDRTLQQQPVPNDGQPHFPSTRLRCDLSATNTCQKATHIVISKRRGRATETDWDHAAASDKQNTKNCTP